MFQTTISSIRRHVILKPKKTSNIIVRSVRSKPIIVSLEEAKDIPLCINCKYFNPNTNKQIKDAKYGECKKYGEVSVIDGSIVYKQVTIAREYFCHGLDFKPIDLKEIDPDSHKAFLK